jgi:hypothetical protein
MVTGDMVDTSQQQIETFVQEWPSSSAPARDIFLLFLKQLQGLADSRLEFHARPGVSYSLRGVRQERTVRPLFVMVDVIDDEPRWLSVCFYGQAITDPEQRGDFVPGGLLGEDGHCFDIEGTDSSLVAYVQGRIVEAHAAAA